MSTRVAAAGGVQRSRDVTLTVEVTARVGEVARALVRGGAGHPSLMPYAVHRHAPLTLLVQYPDGAALMLDSGDAIVASGLRSGSFVEPVLESPAHAEASRAKAPVAYLTVLDDEQEGVTFLAVRGETTIGRDRSNRVELHDSGVSRRHAILRTVGDRLELEDLGSANGTARLSAGGERLPTEGPVIPVAGTTVVEVGTVRVRIDVGPPGQPEPALQSAVPHLQAPQVDPVFAPDAIALPSPPDAPEPTRFPLIAMLAPLVLGSVLFLATQSVLSLIFIALSPIIMIGTWLDNLLSRRRANRAKQREFGAALGLARQELEQNREQEQQSRGEETPPSGDLAELPTQRAPRLWGRRPEHRAFLELRLGNATLPSRKQIELPPRGSIPAEAWEELLQLHERYRTVQDVPMLERLDRCGSLGIAGHELWAGGAARSVLVQLLSQHSPADLVFTAFADPAHARGDWAWLKWIPHVDSAFSPIRAPHLVADERSAGVLLTELEGLIHARTQPAPSRSVRSRMTGSAEDGKERLTPVGDRAVTPAIIVFVLSDTIVDRTRLVGLAEDGPDAGVHVIWVAEHLGAVPAACRTTVEALPSAWRTHFVRQGEVAPLTALESVDLPVAERFGRALAPILDAGARVLDESDFPRSVPLAQIVPGDILDSGTAVLRNWEQTDSLVSRWGFGAEREAGRLAAVVGQGSAGPVEIDLRVQGPHALVGGTTGSGKSEFLQSWIFSLAGNYAPDRVTFLLVDYKGGAAFSDCVDLPHTVGLVTDLNTHLVRRALTSLRAELRYREELLAEKGAKDLVALERRGDPEAPPALVIVIDEFAALVNEIPEFVDGVIDVAQRGRSLGLHLVMATQRPAGVIKDNLRANTNLRIALRMADATDSSDVIGVNDAAGFSPDVPGRAAMRIGAGRLTHFQSGYLGGRSDSDLRDVVEIRDLEFGEHSPWTLQPEVRHAPARATKGPTDIEVLAANIRKAAEAAGTVRPRRPWVDQLPEFIPLGSDLLALRPSARERETTGLVVGLIDEPHLQRQSPYEIPLAEVGNVAIFGGAGSGKTTALITAACASIHATPETQIYGVDCGGGRLGMLASLPNTGDIVPLDERDRVVRLLRLIRTLVAGRVAMRTDDPPVLLFIDGFAAFRDAYEHHGGGIDPFADLVEIARGGRTVGVHVLLTSERSVGLPTSLAASVPERLVLRLPAEHDYNSLGVPTGILENAGPGRALRIGSNQEIQLATPGTDPADTDTAIKDLAADQQRLGITRPPGVAAVPESLRRTEIPHELDRPVPFAIDTAHLAPVPAPEHGFLLVTGPAGSGRTTTIRSLLEAFEEDATRTEQQLDATLLSPRRSSLRDLPLWGGIADTVDTRDRTIAKLIRALGGHSPKPAGLQLLPLIGTTPQATPEEAVEPEPIVFPAAGRRGIVVIEDIGGFDGSGNEQQLATLLKLLRRSDITTIIEGENATLSSVWELTSPLRGARWAIALQPDANDVPSLFSTPFAHAKRAESPAGRGYLIRNGTLTGVHIGLPDTHRS